MSRRGTRGRIPTLTKLSTMIFQRTTKKTRSDMPSHHTEGNSTQMRRARLCGETLEILAQQRLRPTPGLGRRAMTGNKTTTMAHTASHNTHDDRHIHDQSPSLRMVAAQTTGPPYRRITPRATGFRTLDILAQPPSSLVTSRWSSISLLGTGAAAVVAPFLPRRQRPCLRTTEPCSHQPPRPNPCLKLWKTYRCMT